MRNTVRTDKSSISVDPSWKSLPRIGGISMAIAGVLLIIYVATTLYTGQFTSPATGLARVYAQLYWTGSHSFAIGLGLVLETLAVILLIPAFAALYVVLSKMDRSSAFIGAALAASGILVFLSSVPDSFNYVQAADLFNRCNDCQPIAAFSAISTFSVNLADLLALFILAVAIIVLGLVMMKSVYLKGTGYLGTIAGIVPIGLGLLILATPSDVNFYFVQTIFLLFAVWFFAAALKLYRL